MEQDLETFRQRLAMVVKEEFIEEWLDRPNSAFGDRKPIDLVNQGDFEPLFRMLYRLESGEPG